MFFQYSCLFEEFAYHIYQFLLLKSIHIAKQGLAGQLAVYKKNNIDINIIVTLLKKHKFKAVAYKLDSSRFVFQNTNVLLLETCSCERRHIELNFLTVRVSA